MTTLGLRFPLTGVAWLDVLVTVFWIVAITNAFNLLDNMDGLAAGIAVIAGGIRLLLFLNEGQMEAAFITADSLRVWMGDRSNGSVVNWSSPSSPGSGWTASASAGSTPTGCRSCPSSPTG